MAKKKSNKTVKTIKGLADGGIIPAKKTSTIISDQPSESRKDFRDNKVSKEPEIEEVEAVALVWTYIRDINFGEHKVGDLYKGDDQEALEAKGWIALK